MVRFALLRTEWVRVLVFCSSPHPDDAHGRAAPAKLHALGGPLALSILSERYLTKKAISITRSPPQKKKEKKGGARTMVQRMSPEAVISTVPRTRASSGSAVAVCQSPAMWIVGRPGHAAGARE